MFGMRSEPRSASAATEAFPRKCAITRSRTSPAMRLRKIPAATRKACRPTPKFAAAEGVPSGLVEVVTLVFVPFNLVYKRECPVGEIIRAAVLGTSTILGFITGLDEGTTHAFQQQT